MNSPLRAPLAQLADTAAALIGARSAAHEAWSDSVFRDLDERVLSRLSLETKLALTAMDHADELLHQAQQLLEA